MNLLKNKLEIKYKLLSFDELVINLDRLSRFKLPEENFNRVFNSIIYKNLIFPKYSKIDIEELDPKIIGKIVEEIWNKSVANIFAVKNINTVSNQVLKISILETFKNINERTKTYINTKLNFSDILKNIDYETAPINLKFLIKADKEFSDKKKINIDDLTLLRNKYSLLFPIKKLIIVEGITEEILLPVFANKMKSDFNKEGIFILGAGGKSKSPTLYTKVKDKIKIPIIFLFDSDAKEICTFLQDNIEKKDKIILIESGEFEDIISLNLLKRALNDEYKPATPIIKEELHIYKKMCENIENFYRTRHLGEFKKSKLSKIIAKNIKYNTDITNEIREIILSIV